MAITETSLSKTIDKLAEQKSQAFLEKIRREINNAINPLFRPKEIGDEWCGEDIATVLSNIAGAIRERNRDTQLVPSKKLIDSFRAAILKELLDNMPRITELANMRQEMEQSE